MLIFLKIFQYIILKDKIKEGKFKVQTYRKRITESILY